MGASNIRKAETQGLRNRLNIPLNTRPKMKNFNMPQRNMTIHQKSQNWNPLRRITKPITLKYGCTTPDGSTAEQPGLLTSVSKNRLFDLAWIWRPNKKGSLCKMDVLTQVLQLLEMFSLKFCGPKEKSLWLDLIMISQRNTFQLDLQQLPLIYQMVPLLLI